MKDKFLLADSKLEVYQEWVLLLKHNATQNVWFLICLFKLPLSPYGITSNNCIATMLFLQYIMYSSSFFGTLKNEIPGAVLELCQLQLQQFLPDILKFSTKHFYFKLFYGSLHLFVYIWCRLA